MKQNKEYLSVLEFLVTTDKLKSVERRGYISDLSRHDNPAEHTWHMMLSMVLFNELNDQKINLHHALCLALIHDIVEVFAGDTPVYETKNREKQKEVEKKAAEKIFNILPPNIAEKFLSWWHEFENNKTDEAKFANQCDYLQGFTQSYMANGKSWKEMGITRQITESKTTPISEENDDLARFIQVLYQKIDEKSLLP